MASGNRPSKSSNSNKRSNMKSDTGKDSGQTRREPLIDSRMRTDITAVLVAVCGLALLFSVLAPDTGILSNYLSRFLLLGFGVGAYVLPIAVFLWAVGIFIDRKSRILIRSIIGFGIIILALLALFALFTSGAKDDPSAIFVSSSLMTHGGYLGGAIAYALLKLVGFAIALVILIGIVLVGTIILGFSLRRTFRRARDNGVTRRLSQGRRTAPEKRSLGTRPLLHSGSDDGYPHESGEPDDGFDDGYPDEDDEDAYDADFDEQDGDLDDPASDVGATKVLSESEQPSDSSDDGAEDMTIRLERDEDADRPWHSRRTVRLDGEKASSAEPSRKGRRPRNSALHRGDDALDDAEGFQLPDPALLKHSTRTEKLSKAEQKALKETARRLQQTLADFNLDVDVVGWVSGPTFTMFKVDMPSGVRLARITSLQNDIALALAAESVRIFAPIPGTSLVGIEIPNKKRSTVLLGDVLDSVSGGPLMLGIGKDVEGNAISADLARMPHLLIGGTTGSGKSVAINAMLISILMRATPDEVRLILIDPKRVELSVYNGIPHLYVPVVTNPKEASSVLAWATIEMDRRLKVFERAEARDIGVYNGKVRSGELEDETETMPYIVVVIDELSDLMMVAGKEVEGSITRIAQLARAAGIHLIVATQRPSSNVVTGMIKANIVNRFAFKVATGLESRVILDQNGAERLIGLGDLLFLDSGGGRPKRIQGCYVSDKEISDVVGKLKEQGEPVYHDEILQTQAQVSTSQASLGASSDDDPLLWEAAELVVESQLGSTSNIQRRLKVGYSRAGRIMDQLYEKGIVGPPDGSKPREVLISDVLELETLRAFDEEDV